MDKEIGNPDFPIWLIGDSNPKQWESYLVSPLDPRHPIRHNIWTAVADVFQDKVYREAKLRVDTSKIYIRNAIENADNKPKQSDIQWDPLVEEEISGLNNSIHIFKPIMVIPFGAFSYEFVRRACGESEEHNYEYWGAKRLGNEFRYRMESFDPSKTNIIPLLHRSIAGGKFIESHEYFCNEKGANYFEFVGTHLAEILLQYQEKLKIWIN
jgi:hypothetical protein